MDTTFYQDDFLTKTLTTSVLYDKSKLALNFSNNNNDGKHFEHFIKREDEGSESPNLDFLKIESPDLERMFMNLNENADSNFSNEDPNIAAFNLDSDFTASDNCFTDALQMLHDQSDELTDINLLDVPLKEEELFGFDDQPPKMRDVRDVFHSQTKDLMSVMPKEITIKTEDGLSDIFDQKPNPNNKMFHTPAHRGFGIHRRRDMSLPGLIDNHMSANKYNINSSKSILNSRNNILGHKNSVNQGNSVINPVLQQQQQQQQQQRQQHMQANKTLQRDLENLPSMAGINSVLKEQLNMSNQMALLNTMSQAHQLQQQQQQQQKQQQQQQEIAFLTQAMGLQQENDPQNMFNGFPARTNGLLQSQLQQKLLEQQLLQQQMNGGVPQMDGIGMTNMDNFGQITVDERTLKMFVDNPHLAPLNVEIQELIKRERKKLRNRIASSKCRKRKLEREGRLEDRVKDLKEKNIELGAMATSLKQQVCDLKQRVMEHVGEGCQIMLAT